MATLYIRHSLNSKKTIQVIVSFRYFVDRESSGDHIWTLEIGTVFKDRDGKDIDPIRVYDIDVDTIDELMLNNAAIIASKIDWAPLSEDKYVPQLINIAPVGENVSLTSSIIIDIIDDLPSSGLDLSELNIILNNGTTDFDITSEVKVTGNPYKYNLYWATKIRVNDTYM